MVEHAARVSTKVAPNWLLQLMAVFNSQVRQLIPDLGKIRRPDSEKAKRMFDWVPRSNEEAILATGESLVRLGLLRK
jgi:dihydroflavonol-4-reductase